MKGISKLAALVIIGISVSMAIISARASPVYPNSNDAVAGTIFCETTLTASTPTQPAVSVSTVSPHSTATPIPRLTLTKTPTLAEAATPTLTPTVTPTLTQAATPTPTLTATPTLTLTATPTLTLTQLTAEDVRLVLAQDFTEIKSSLEHIEQKVDYTLLEKIRDDLISDVIWETISPGESINAGIRLAIAVIGAVSILGKIYFRMTDLASADQTGKGCLGGLLVKPIRTFTDFSVLLLAACLVVILFSVTLSGGVATKEMVPLNLGSIEERLDSIDKKLQVPSTPTVSPRSTPVETAIDQESLEAADSIVKIPRRMLEMALVSLVLVITGYFLVANVLSRIV